MVERDNSDTVKTWSLWITPLFDIRRDDELVVKGLTKEQGNSIILGIGDRLAGHLNLQPDEI